MAESLGEISEPNPAALFRRAVSSHGADFVRLMVPDMHGLLRGKLYPARSVNAEGEPMIIAALTFMPNGLPADIPDQAVSGFGNSLMVPCPGNIYRLPPSRRRDHGAVIVQALCELKKQDGSPIEPDVRFIARKQLARCVRLQSLSSSLVFRSPPGVFLSALDLQHTAWRSSRLLSLKCECSVCRRKEGRR